MLAYTVAVMLTYMATASSRETMRSLPTITNSLVNLGKMEISFYFNGNNRDSAPFQIDRTAKPFATFGKQENAQEEACPCSSLRNAKDSFINNPAGLLNKILLSNDLFSSNKDPLSSTLCCESHEHIQEGTVVFEFPTNIKNMKPTNTRSDSGTLQQTLFPFSNGMPMLPFLFDTAFPKKSVLPPLKTKSIEIFLFPKNKGTGKTATEKPFPKTKNLLTKDNIQVVGAKDTKNDIAYFKPVFPVVKKDLTYQEKTDKLKEKESENEKANEIAEKEKEEVEQIIIEPANKPNTI